MIQVAIDGPAGSGKSTVAKLIAQEFNFEYIDTGAMYRTIALFALNNNIDLDNSDYKFIDTLDISFKNNNILLNSVNVSKEIRLPKVSDLVSTVAQNKHVRDNMTMLQQKIATGKNVIMDGRDIATNVLPNAQLKFYLDASVDVRAKRRHDENLKKGIKSIVEEIKLSISKRDYEDENREYSPLTKSNDAILIDTSELSILDVVNKIKKHIQELISCYQ